MVPGAGWSLEEFTQVFKTHLSPELLAVILVEALEKLEKYHRSDVTLGSITGDSLWIDEQGGVSLKKVDLPDRLKPSVEVDLETLARLFYGLMIGRQSRDTSARVHPLLRDILMCRRSSRGQQAPHAHS